MTPDFDPAEWMAVDLTEWEIFTKPTTEEDKARLRIAAAEIDSRGLKVLDSVWCRACAGEKHPPLAQLFETSVGPVWRIHHRKDHKTDELGTEPPESFRCPVHGEVDRGGSPIG